MSPASMSAFAKPMSSFCTGTVSPVKADSSMLSLLAFNILASAGTKFPASNIIMSPGTTWLDGISHTFPSLFTFATGEAIFDSASNDFSALLS